MNVMDSGYFGMGKKEHRVLGVLKEILTVCRTTFVKHDVNHQNSLLT